MQRVNLAEFQSQLSIGNRLLRGVWGVVWLCLFRPSPRICFAWRRMLLRIFGASIKENARVYNSVQVYYPPNLSLGTNVIVGPHVDLYCVDRITIHDNSMISQYSFLCTASHDASDPKLPLVTAPITIDSQAWICADVFVGMGVHIAEGTVIGARSSIFDDAQPWSVYVGNPARRIKERKFQS